MTVVSDPAEARKRRKEIIQSQRSDTDGHVVNSNVNNTNNASNQENPPPNPVSNAARIVEVDVKHESSSSSTTNTTSQTITVTDKKPPKKRKIEEKESNMTTNKKDKKEGQPKKTQIRYDPDVPMSKEQLAAWRREARRVRNRESAAASRQRIRNRITELEDEVGQWKAKYTQAMERLQNLEQSMTTENGTTADC